MNLKKMNKPIRSDENLLSLNQIKKLLKQSKLL